MKINWEINYQYKIAKCSRITISLREVEKPIMQVFNDVKLGFGFTKNESGKMYQGYIIDISNELLIKTKESPDLLANYARQLGDIFNEYQWDDARVDDLKIFLGKYPKQQELADYLGVNKATVSGYSDKKKKVWLHGLWLLRKLKADSS